MSDEADTKKANRLRKRAARNEGDRIRDEWMTKNGLQRCRAHGLRWVAKVGSDLRKVKNGSWQHPELNDSGKFDHCETFYHPAGRYYVMVSQPYATRMTDTTLDELREFCAPHGILVEMSQDGWHNPKLCPLIVFRPG